MAYILWTRHLRHNPRNPAWPDFDRFVLRGLQQNPPCFRDGRAPDLLAVVNRYDGRFGLNLTAAQKADLVEFLKTL